MASLNTEKLVGGLKEYFNAQPMLDLVAQLKEVGLLKKISRFIQITLVTHRTRKRIVVPTHMIWDHQPVWDTPSLKYILTDRFTVQRVIYSLS